MTLVTMSRWSMLLACAGLIVSCGGGGGSDGDQPLQSPVSSTTPAQPTSASNSTAALALFDAARVHSYMTTAPFMYYGTGASGVIVDAWRSGPCIENSGSRHASLDGSPVVADARLPVGNHTYTVTFANCSVDNFAGITLDGTATAVYATTDWSNVTAQVSTGSMRATGSVDPYGTLSDVSAFGSGTLRVTATLNTSSETYTPAIGSTLINNRTTNVITFQSGSLSSGYDNTGSTAIYRRTFDSLAITLNGTNYLLDGTLQFSYVNGRPAGAGEVRITSNGVLVARIVMDSQVRAEVLAPLDVF